ncbi:MAG: tRNA (adenine(22)-N(1))-methyltransferase TrmK, partial [Lysinibacillus sp.]
KIYEIIVLQRGSMDLTEGEMLFGPKLMLRKSPVFQKKWTREQQNWQRVIASIEAAEQTVEIVEKRQELTQLLDLVEGVL